MSQQPISIAAHEIKDIFITLQVANNQALFILLASDGTINRLGDGSPDCKDHDLYIGQTDTIPIIEELKASISPEMIEFLHRTYDAPEKKGRICHLKIGLKTDSIETGVDFIYGEHSMGVPTEFARVVTKAVQLTNPWHASQKRASAQAQPQAKPWWKFW
jgi:hypothetical protein